MFRLTGFELEKLWGKRRFRLSCLLLLLLELFLMWYTTLPAEGKAGLSAYKAFQKQISAMSEAEKQAYVTGLKETMDGMALVQDSDAAGHGKRDGGQAGGPGHEKRPRRVRGLL